MTPILTMSGPPVLFTVHLPHVMPLDELQEQIGPIPTNYSKRRLQKNLEVVPKGPSSNVVKVHSDHLVEGRATAAVYLPNSGHSWLSFRNPPAMPELVVFELIR